MRYNMMALSVVGILTMVLGAVGAEPEATPEATVEVVGIQVGIKGFGYDQEWDRYEHMPFNMQRPGIAVALALEYPTGGIIEMDEDQSELLVFKDDKGTDLLAKPENTRFGNEPGFGSFPKVTDDGKAMLFSVESPTLPVNGARLVGLAGRLALKTGSARETAEAKGVALKVGSKLKLGAYDFEISEAGKPEWGDDALAVTFKTSKELDGVIGFTFHGSDGAEIESSEAGSSTMKFGSMVTVERSFSFASEPTAPVTVRMTYWADLKQVKVPFRAKTGLMP